MEQYVYVIIILLIIFIICIYFIRRIIPPLLYSPCEIPSDYEPSDRASNLRALSLPDVIDVIWKNLPTGHILYNPSSEMRVGIEERIEVRISNSSIENLNKGLKGRGYPQSEEIKVSSRMIVRLEGGGNAFEIVKLFAEGDMAIVGDYTQWEWDVIPLKSGIHKLDLCVDAIIETPNLPERVKHLSVLEREVNVKVNPKYQVGRFVRSHWQYVITTIIALVLAIVAIFNYFKTE